MRDELWEVNALDFVHHLVTNGSVPVQLRKLLGDIGDHAKCHNSRGERKTDTARLIAVFSVR
jgi:hypothetical protein